MKVCPVCGSPELECRVVVAARQNPEGEWNIVYYDPSDITYEVNDANQEVYCTNDMCGSPIDPYTGEVFSDLDATATKEQLFEKYNFVHMSLQKTLEACTEEEKEEFEKWFKEIYYDHWSGVISECGEI